MAKLTKLTKKQIEEIRCRIERDRASGFSFVSLPIKAAEALLAAAERHPTGAGRAEGEG